MDKPKDRWDKLHAVAAVMIPVVLAGVGWWTSRALENMQERQAGLRLYTELMAQREQAENGLRKDMFSSILDSFLRPDQPATLGTQVLMLELLAYNFHESLVLAPLFKDLAQQVRMSREPEDSVYGQRLSRLAREVARRQTVALSSVGQQTVLPINLQEVRDSLRDASRGFVVLESIEIRDDPDDAGQYASDTLGGHTRTYDLSILSVDMAAQELEVRLTIHDPLVELPLETQFTLDFFDFPMVDNIRLTGDQRCALVLDRFEENGATIILLLFPGSRASMRERADYDDILDKLQLRKVTRGRDAE
jgi:hypothetical protein